MTILIISCPKEAFWRTCSMNGQKAFARVTGRLVKCVSALETAKLTSKLVQNPFFNHTNHYSRCQQCPSFVTCSAEKTDTLQKNLQLTHWSNVRVTFILLSPACQSVFISLLSVCHQKYCHCSMVLVTFLQPAKGNIYLMCSVISFLIKYISRIRTSYRRHSILFPLEYMAWPSHENSTADFIFWL